MLKFIFQKNDPLDPLAYRDWVFCVVGILSWIFCVLVVPAVAAIDIRISDFVDRIRKKIGRAND